MTKRILLAALLAGLATSISIYAIQAAGAVAPAPATVETPVASAFHSLDQSYPAPTVSVGVIGVWSKGSWGAGYD
ncbi:hypothetical protein D3C85_1561280 [compost metagenome]